MKAKKRKKPEWTNERQAILRKYDKTLRAIAQIGTNVPETSIEWRNCFRQARYLAQEAIRVRCSRCGK